MKRVLAGSKNNVKMPLGGLKWRGDIEREDPLKNPKEPEPEEEPPKDAAPHVKVYHYVRKKHRHIKRLKHKYFPGIYGELVSFLIALLIAWAFLQMLGWMLGTASPLVVVESESMIHPSDTWKQWYLDRNLTPDSYGGALNVGDIVLVKGDDPNDIRVGDVVVYTKYGGAYIGGEPVIHRVVGIVEIHGDEAFTYGVAGFENGSITTPCNRNNGFSLDEIRSLYSTDVVKKFFPGIEGGLEDFKLFITKGDNNAVEDQCRSPGMISYPIHERLVQGRAKMDIPYLGYVKLGIVCGVRYATGNVCNCRCWWTADHPNCCSGNEA